MGRPTVIVTDPASVDPDDVLAFLMIPHIKDTLDITTVITVHHRSKERADIATKVLSKLGLYVDVAYRDEPADAFHEENPKWPPFFGDPVDPSADKQWFPDFGKAYVDLDTDTPSMPPQAGGLNKLIELLSNYEPLCAPLMVVVLGPMHLIADVPTHFYPRMELAVMGGGFEEDPNADRLVIPKPGYNWGIAPAATQRVLEKLRESKTSMTLVSSNFVRREELWVSPDLFNRWVMNPSNMPLPIAIMADWQASIKGNALTDHKNLCDPATLMIAAGKAGTVTTKSFSVDMNLNCPSKHYLEAQPADDQMLIMCACPPEEANVHLVTEISDRTGLVDAMTSNINSVLGMGEVFKGNSERCSVINVLLPHEEMVFELKGWGY